MMTGPCFNPDDLGELLTLPPTDARLSHLDDCPACRTMLASYRKFLDDSANPSGCDRIDAGIRLDSFIREQILGGAPTVTEAEPQRRVFFASILRSLRSPIVRPVLAVGSLLAIALLSWDRFDPGQRNQPPDLLRGEEDRTADSFTSMSAARHADGSFQLTWSVVEGAEVYQVLILSATLDELTRIGVQGETSLRLPAEQIPRSERPAPLFWQVVALRDGQRLDQSRIAALDPSH